MFKSPHPRCCNYQIINNKNILCLLHIKERPFSVLFLRMNIKERQAIRFICKIVNYKLKTILHVLKIFKVKRH
jgi:hypothetical protein